MCDLVDEIDGAYILEYVDDSCFAAAFLACRQDLARSCALREHPYEDDSIYDRDGRGRQLAIVYIHLAIAMLQAASLYVLSRSARRGTAIERQSRTNGDD